LSGGGNREKERKREREGETEGTMHVYTLPRNEHKSSTISSRVGELRQTTEAMPTYLKNKTKQGHTPSWVLCATRRGRSWQSFKKHAYLSPIGSPSCCPATRTSFGIKDHHIRIDSGDSPRPRLQLHFAVGAVLSSWVLQGALATRHVSGGPVVARCGDGHSRKRGRGIATHGPEGAA
jgi:hypothetical protein